MKSAGQVHYMPRRSPLRTEGGIREFPRYSIPEAAFYLRIPRTTLHAWVRGQDYVTSSGKHRRFQPLISPADKARGLLSFVNLVEAHILRSTTEQGVPFSNVRKALDYVNQTIPVEHPLITLDFETSGKELFVTHLGQTINATTQGQLTMREILERHLKLIYRDSQGSVIRVSPINSKRLVIDPLFSSGKPIVRDRGIAASILWGRNNSGESIAEIAKDYGLPEIEVKEAIEDYNWQAAA